MLLVLVLPLVLLVARAAEAVLGCWVSYTNQTSPPPRLQWRLLPQEQASREQAQPLQARPWLQDPKWRKSTTTTNNNSNNNTVRRREGLEAMAREREREKKGRKKRRRRRSGMCMQYGGRITEKSPILLLRL
jgi:hypothetical protein